MRAIGRAATFVVAALASLSLAAPGASAAGPDPYATAFSPPRYVDRHFAGGEPLVLADRVHGTLIYSAHEGTTHLYRSGIPSVSTAEFAGHYRDQVVIWISRDDGITWSRVDWGRTGFRQNPYQNLGFSDPDLTQDEGGRVYNTGIDLVNDAIFSSNDGGATWDRGTPTCHNGDRPWLAGGRPDEVFVAIDTLDRTPAHQIFHSQDGGRTCSSEGIPDGGELPNGGSFGGYGPLLYDHREGGRLAEPALFYNGDGELTGIGASTWRRGEAGFRPVPVAPVSGLATFFPLITQDRAGYLYLVWATDERAAGTDGGCGGTRTPLPNSIQMAVSHDFGRTWSSPVTIARPAGARVLWPWATAGAGGRVSVVWYQLDRVVDIDCEEANVYIYEAHVMHAADPERRTIEVVNASGRPIHRGSMCQSGTTCVATGQDRRLGDYFSNATDQRGCVIIASGDNMLSDPLGGPMITSRPIFIRQTSGLGLIGPSAHRGCGPKPLPERTRKRHRRRHR